MWLVLLGMWVGLRLRMVGLSWMMIVMVGGRLGGLDAIEDCVAVERGSNELLGRLGAERARMGLGDGVGVAIFATGIGGGQMVGSGRGRAGKKFGAGEDGRRIRSD